MWRIVVLVPSNFEVPNLIMTSPNRVIFGKPFRLENHQLAFLHQDMSHGPHRSPKKLGYQSKSMTKRDAR